MQKHGELDERLCEEIRKYPHLYNSCLKEHKDLFRAATSWKEISTNLGKEEAFCRQRWKNLRDRYVKAARKLKGKSGDPGETKAVPQIVVMLGWLSSFVKHRETDTNFAKEVECAIEPGTLSSINMECINPDPVEPVEPVALPSSSSSSSSSSSPDSLQCMSSSPCTSVPSTSPPDAKKRKREQFSPVQEEIMARLQKYDEDNELEDEAMRFDMCFGKMVGKRLSKLSTRSKAHACLEISQVLFKWQMEDCDS